MNGCVRIVCVLYLIMAMRVSVRLSLNVILMYYFVLYDYVDAIVLGNVIWMIWKMGACIYHSHICLLSLYGMDWCLWVVVLAICLYVVVVYLFYQYYYNSY